MFCLSAQKGEYYYADKGLLCPEVKEMVTEAMGSNVEEQTLTAL